PTRTRAIEHQFTRGLGLDEHGILAAVHRGKRVLPIDQRRVDASRHTLDAVSRGQSLSDCEQLDDVPRTRRGLDLWPRHRVNALAVRRVNRHLGMVCDASQDRGFLCGVVALNIERWIGLWVAELTRDTHRLFGGVAKAIHAVKN